MVTLAAVTVPEAYVELPDQDVKTYAYVPYDALARYMKISAPTG